MMRVIGKRQPAVVPSAKTGKNVYMPEQCDEVDELLLIAGPVKLLQHVLF